MEKKSVITSIEKQKKAKRYNIYINDSYAFSVHEDILVKYRITKGLCIEEDEWKEILEADEKNRVRQYALSYLSYRVRTESEVIRYLQGKGFQLADCQMITEECCKSGYIDDRRYAEQWIAARQQNRPRGRYVLRMELLNRGIEESIIEEQLQKLNEQDEEQMIKELIEKKTKGKKFTDGFSFKKKIVPYLQRKGFLLEQIIYVVDKQIKSFGDNDMDEK